MKVRITKMVDGRIITDDILWPDPTENLTISWDAEKSSPALPVGKWADVDYNQEESDMINSDGAGAKENTDV